MSRAKRALVGLFALSVVVVPPVAHAREVRHCGITIANGKTGTLVKDVQCGQHCIDDPTASMRTGGFFRSLATSIRDRMMAVAPSHGTSQS